MTDLHALDQFSNFHFQMNGLTAGLKTWNVFFTELSAEDTCP